MSTAILAPTETPTQAPDPTPTPTASPTPMPIPNLTPTPTLRPTTNGVPGPLGIAVPGMASFDRIIADLMARWEIPGGAVAVVKDGRLVLARGYGLADIERDEPVQSGSLFRIASISKPITAVAVLKLAQEGRLDLDDKAFQLLEHLQAPTGATTDSGIYDITIRQLLRHSGGWVRDRSFDPMFIPERAARGVGAPEPATCETIIRFMLGQPLQFYPGTQYAYSNFGYCILGRIIEEVTGQSYDEYVRSQVLQPMGITRMRIGATLLDGRVEGEVRYYNYPRAGSAYPVFPDVPGRVPWPYGGFYLEAMDAHGGWVASPIDLMRFVTSVDGSRSPVFLEPETVSLMVSRPDTPDWEGTSSYYGMGWRIRPVRNNANWWHVGDLPGTTTILVRTYHGLAWAALFNSRPRDSEKFQGELDDALWEAVRGVTKWPSHDLFQQ